jgi:hemolysin activation/secretion protein
VLGNSLLASTDIERAVYEHLGPDRAIEDVEAARVALEQAYRARGYATVYVDIPEQDVDSGVVRLHITEGRLNRVVVEGARYFSGRQIRARFTAAEQGATPDLAQLQQQLSQVNSETRDRQITPVLAAGPVPGTLDLKLKVGDSLPLHGSLDVNDRYTADTTRLRVTAAVSYDNLFNRLDSLGLQYQTSPQSRSEVGVLAASYSARLSERGDRFTFLYVNSDSSVAALGTLSVLGRGQIFSPRFVLPVSNTAEGSHTLSFGLDYKDFRETIQLDVDNSVRTPIAYLNANLGYTGVARTEGRQWNWSSTVNLGLRSRYNDPDEFGNKRYLGRPNYIYLRSDASARFELPYHFGLRATLGGQYAIDPLIGNEQLAMGGADSVRGYLEAEALGDMGLRASLEAVAPALRTDSGRFSLEGYAFFDAGRVATLSPLPGEVRNTDLRSWGLGLSLSLFNHVDGVLQWAYPLVDSAHVQAGDSRIHFSVRSAW